MGAIYFHTQARLKGKNEPSYYKNFSLRFGYTNVIFQTQQIAGLWYANAAVNLYGTLRLRFLLQLEG